MTPTPDFHELCEQLARAAESPSARTVVQALAEERTILDIAAARYALTVDVSGGAMACFEGLAGRQYTLGLDERQRAFLGLVLSMVGIGLTTVASVQDLDERRLPIILRAIVRLAGNDTIAVGTRM
ncbi:hypothetical protein [Streptomyces sp. NPDC002611]